MTKWRWDICAHGSPDSDSGCSVEGQCLCRAEVRRRRRYEAKLDIPPTRSSCVPPLAKNSRQRMLISAARVISRTSRCNGDFSCQVGRPADRITMNRGLPRGLLRSLPSQPRVGPRTARPLILRGLISMNKFRTPWAHGTGPVSQADISR